MQILIVSGIFPPDIGGPAGYVPRIASELVRKGHGVTVICLSDSVSDPDGRHPFRVLRIRRGLAYPLRILACVAAVAREARRADMVYVNGLAFEAMLGSLAAGKPTCHKIVGDYAWERARNRGWFAGSIEEYQAAPKGLRMRFFDWVRTVPLRRADSVIVPSVWLKGMVEGWGIPAGRVSVVYNASEEVGSVGEASELPRHAGKTLITVCRLVSWKGVDGILRALAGIPEVRLVVVGDGPLRRQLEELAASAGVADRVVFLGNVPGQAVPALLGQADAFVLNSSYEGLPHVVLEAARAGVPVVATRTGGTPEVVADGVTGLLVAPGDDSGLRAALARILGDPSLARRLASAARDRLETSFSYRAMIENTERLLTALAEPRDAVPAGAAG